MRRCTHGAPSKTLSPGTASCSAIAYSTSTWPYQMAAIAPMQLQYSRYFSNTTPLFFTYLKVPEGTCAHKHKHKHKHTKPAAPWDQNLTPSMALLPTSLPQTAPSSWCPLGIQECCYCHCTHYPTNTHQPHRLHQLSTLQSHGSPSPSGSHTSALCSSGLPSKLAACSSRSPARSHLQPPMNRL